MAYRLDLLKRHHERLLEIVGTARPLITGSARDADLIGLRYLRQEMVEALASYARLVGEMVDEANDRHDPHAITASAKLQAHCLAMGTSYEAFRARWAERAALENWAEYRLSAVHMMKRIRDEIIASARARVDTSVEAA